MKLPLPVFGAPILLNYSHLSDEAFIGRGEGGEVFAEVEESFAAWVLSLIP